MTPRVAGLLLAAGAGRRFGGPKALRVGWLRDRVDALVAGGCEPVVAVLGAQAEEARALVPPAARVVIATDWAAGMGASFRVGLSALADDDVDAALIVLVDVPGLTGAAVARVRAAAEAGPSSVLAQACYDGRPGHPVLLGHDHWSAAAATAVGDRGAREYLARHTVTRIECSDVADGRDVDDGDSRPSGLTASFAQKAL